MALSHNIVRRLERRSLALQTAQVTVSVILLGRQVSAATEESGGARLDEAGCARRPLGYARCDRALSAATAA